MKRKLGSVLCIIIILIANYPVCDSYAAAFSRKISLSQAVQMGLTRSKDYKKVKSKIALKEVKYKEAVKSIYLKKKNMSTFRWSPLLKFKFPEKATLSEEFEFVYKPLQIQSEIDVLEHQLTDIQYEVTEEISNLYTEIYTYQEKIAYQQELLESYRENLKKNQARLAVGEAKQSDVDKIQSSVTAAENTLAADKRAFEQAKAELSDDIGLNVTSGYTFLNPYVEADIDRGSLEQLITVTLDRSHSYYEAKMTEKLALTALDTNYRLMQGQYGWKMSYISSYVTQAKSGTEIDTDSFKKAYDNFLTAIDSPWVGKKRILFIKIPKEWFKGSIDGVRYVEDDPYLLYSNVLEYQEAVDDRTAIEKEIRKNVESGFENLVTAKNTYDFQKQQVDKAKEEMDRARLKNQMGELEYEEYEAIRQEYEELQIQMMEALELYTQQVYSYDRLTCGGITELLSGKANSLEEGGQGISYVTEEESGLYYYINSIVEDSVFQMGIYVTEDCDTTVTAFELWIDGTQVGERTDLDKTIRHLTLDLEQTDKVIVRLYDGSQFVADCEINPQEYQGILNVPDTAITENEDTKRVFGTYTYTLNKKTGMVEISIKTDEKLNIGYYRLTDETGTAIYSDEPVEITKSVTYLSVITADLENIRIILYDNEKKQMAEGHLESSGRQIVED